MNDLLPDQLQIVRRRVRRALCLYGVSWIVAVLLGGLLAVGFADWLLRLDDPGVRLILALGLLGATAWVAWGALVRPLLRPLSDVDLALRIERRFPGFRDSLASTVQFLQAKNNPELGSPELQRQVIQETLLRVGHTDVSDVVQTRGIRRVAALAIAICLAAALLGAFHPTAAVIAVSRLTSPFSAPDWPRTTDLRFLREDFSPLPHRPHEPLRMVRGETLRLLVEDTRGTLPQDVLVQYDFGEGERGSQTPRRTALRDKGGRTREVGVVTLPARPGRVRFRAVGGDDDTMPWYTLETIPPPAVESLQVTLTPPDYTGREVEQLPQRVGNVEGIVGTRVDVRARVNKPLKSARLHVKNQSPRPAELSADGREFKTSFTIREAGVSSYWFELTDREGFEHPEAPRYEIHGIADLVPEVYIDRPATNVQVTPQATVPIRVVAKDDLGLKRIGLRYRSVSTEDIPEQFLVIREADTPTARLVQDYAWNLGEFSSLVPGMQLKFHAEATDAYDLGEGHVGRSLSRTLTIVSPETKADELASRQAELLEELRRAFETQQQAHGQVGELKLQLEKADQLRPEDIDLLKRIELDQQRVSAQLTNPADGIESSARQLLSEMDSNRIDRPGMRLRLERMAGKLSRLRENDLAPIEQHLTEARKKAQTRGQESGRPSPDEIQRQADALAEAHTHQKNVLESLGAILDRLSQWNDQRELTGALEEIIEQQEEVNRETAELGQQTLTKSDSELTAQERADLARLADRQRRQARQLEQFREKLNAMADQLSETRPEAAQRARDMQRSLSDQATASRMRDIAEQLQANRIGRASTAQHEVLRELRQLTETLTSRDASSAETMVKRLEQAEEELETLQKRQEELRRQVEQAEQLADSQQREQELQRLRKRQQELRDEVDQLARRLQRLQAGQSGDSARQAGRQMQQAENALGRNSGQEALKKQGQALKELEHARQQLAQTRRQAEEQLARQMLERVADEIRDMVDRQQGVIDETRRLDEARQERGNWSRAQLKSLLNLAEVQRGLKQETDRLIEKLQSAEVFALALEGASRSMRRAADRLVDRKTGEVTLRAEQAARQRFVDLVEALKNVPGDGQDGRQDDAQNAREPNENRGPPSDGIPPLAQLKMLKTLQVRVVERTAELDKLRRQRGELSSEQKDELAALAEEQGRLADLARNLSRSVMRSRESENGNQDRPADEEL